LPGTAPAPPSFAGTTASAASSGDGRSRGGQEARNRYRYGQALAAALAGAGAAAGTGPDLAGLTAVRTSRNDHLATGDVLCELFLSPAVYGMISAGYARLHSTDSFETCRQLHAGAYLSWDMTDRWRLQLEAELRRAAYDESPLRVQRTDHRFSASGQVSRFIGPGELYGKIGWLKNNSKVNDEFYHQMVTQCGYCWYF